MHGVLIYSCRVILRSEDVTFNERILIDIMAIDGDPFLHAVDEATNFSAGSFVPNVYTDNARMILVECWASIYTGLPDRILTDQGSQFREKFIGSLHLLVSPF